MSSKQIYEDTGVIVKKLVEVVVHIHALLGAASQFLTPALIPISCDGHLTFSDMVVECQKGPFLGAVSKSRAETSCLCMFLALV